MAVPISLFLSGEGIGDAAFNFCASVIGVVSPIPLIGKLIKAKKLKYLTIIGL